ncbi:MAG: hypothetical protein KKD77_24275, partial [Gammaproteobacteria bacterium]|nr:hypothetical protein [Gammaproteobacteria bacterium]
MTNVRDAFGQYTNPSSISWWTETIAQMIIEHLNFSTGYPNEVDPVDSVETAAAGTVDDSGIVDPTAAPSISDISVSGAPENYAEIIKHNTAWPTIDVTLETAPDLHVVEDNRETADDPSTEVEGSVTIPDETAEDFTDTYTVKGHQSIPVPPAITISAYTNSIPEFTVTVPDRLLDWAYTQYTSTLLTLLKSEADELLTTPINLSTANAVTRNAQVWDSPSYFLLARGINGLTGRALTENARFKNNITRLIAIMTADYTELNKHSYLEHRQALENFERAMYDARKERRFAYCKAWAENRIQFYGATIESYSQLLNTYRMESMLF